MIVIEPLQHRKHRNLVKIDQKKICDRKVKFLFSKYWLWFDHAKTVEADVEYPSEPGKKVHRVKFYVREITNGKKSDIEEEWTTSVRTSTSIIKWLVKGYYEIDITRFGSQKNDTRYECDPVL
jgi:hypothetical protein